MKDDDGVDETVRVSFAHKSKALVNAVSSLFTPYAPRSLPKEGDLGPEYS